MFVSIRGASMLYQGHRRTLEKQNPLKSLIIELGRQALLIGTPWQGTLWVLGRTMTLWTRLRCRWEVEQIVNGVLWPPGSGKDKPGLSDFSWHACDTQPECRWHSCDSWHSLRCFSDNLHQCQAPAECHRAFPRLKWGKRGFQSSLSSISYVGKKLLISTWLLDLTAVRYKRFWRKLVFKVPFRRCHLQWEFLLRSRGDNQCSEIQSHRKKSEFVFWYTWPALANVAVHHPPSLPLLLAVTLMEVLCPMLSILEKVLGPAQIPLLRWVLESHSWLGGPEDPFCYDSRTNQSQLMKWSDNDYHVWGGRFLCSTQNGLSNILPNTNNISTSISFLFYKWTSWG